MATSFLSVNRKCPLIGNPLIGGLFIVLFMISNCEKGGQAGGGRGGHGGYDRGNQRQEHFFK